MREGSRAWPKAVGLRPAPVGVPGFESQPSNFAAIRLLLERPHFSVSHQTVFLPPISFRFNRPLSANFIRRSYTDRRLRATCSVTSAVERTGSSVSRKSAMISSSVTVGFGPGFELSVIRRCRHAPAIVIPSQALSLLSLPSKVLLWEVRVDKDDRIQRANRPDGTE